MTPVGVVGLGRMGARVARRLLDTGHQVIVWNRSPQRMTALTEHGAIQRPVPPAQPPALAC
jgi:3-hydroxyisobutyrate dehydrogenase-like beta-hydroxyacid dehydrogenase